MRRNTIPFADESKFAQIDGTTITQQSELQGVTISVTISVDPEAVDWPQAFSPALFGDLYSEKILWHAVQKALLPVGTDVLVQARDACESVLLKTMMEQRAEGDGIAAECLRRPPPKPADE